MTLSLVPGTAVYGEKRISVDVSLTFIVIILQLLFIYFCELIIKLFHIMQTEDGEKIEYRVWNPFRSKLAAAILGGVDQIYMPPKSKILYLGAASGTTVSHVADVVGPVSSLIYIRNLCKKDMRNYFIYAYIRAKLAHNCELGVEVMLEKLHARSFSNE